MSELDNVIAPSAPPTDMIGDRFIKAGLLTDTQVQEIIQLQNNSSLRFGEAAIQLGFLTEQQVQSVLSKQFNYATALDPTDKIDSALMIAHMPFGMEAEHIRHLRAEISMRMHGRHPLTLAIVSPDNASGKSYLAASLAIAFSQMGKRTLLIDADMRYPVQHRLFNIPNKTGLSTILAKRTPLFDGQAIASFPHLHVLMAGPIPPNPQEILQESALQNVITELSGQFDIFIVDTPSMNKCSDAQTIAKQTGVCLLLARQDYTLLKDLKKTYADLLTTGAQIIGTVFNHYHLPEDTDDISGQGKKIWKRTKTWLKQRTWLRNKP